MTEFTVPTEQTIEFRGHSDDTFCALLEHGGGDDHDDCASMTLRTWKVTAPDGTGVHVSGRYGLGDGVWMIGLSQLAEDEPLPTWPMAWSTLCYTVVLRLQVPAGTVVRLVEIDGKEIAE